ncbi:MAG: class I SAM-dependent methyltransferase [Deltaproteobacteria bacterium]|nr:class I SAM-dependent methyltransferase [Deltaproteobacteria bacterium]
MTGTSLPHPFAEERLRIVAEYARRAREVPADLWAPWQPAASFLLRRRGAQAARLLAGEGVFPAAGSPCLEVGCGAVGWLGELIGWGLRSADLHGLDLERSRVERARAALPAADIRIGDAAELPWPDERFALVIASTLMSSVLEPRMRVAIAAEITRVLRPGGALLWYDLRVPNPRNPTVRPVSRRELAALFPGLVGPVETATLAAPLARHVAPWSELVAGALERCPWLRTHLLAVLARRT